MKKIMVIMAVLCACVFAGETWHVSPVDGNPLICDNTGYVCKLGVDVTPQNNLLYFQLGLDATCTNLFKSGRLSTNLIYDYIDDQGNLHSDTSASVATRFFLVNDDGLAGSLSMTVAGSIAESAYNKSTPVRIVYRQVHGNEYGGVRILGIMHDK